MIFCNYPIHNRGCVFSGLLYLQEYDIDSIITIDSAQTTY